MRLRSGWLRGSAVTRHCPPQAPVQSFIQAPNNGRRDPRLSVGPPAPGVTAQEARAPTRTLIAAPLGPNETIDLDGRLDEAAWARAIPAEGFRQVEPDNGAPATERTEVRILIDADRLILGIMAYDSDPGAVRGNVMQRDAPFLGDARFAWTLDTYQDGRTGYYFEGLPLDLVGTRTAAGPRSVRPPR